MTKATKSSKAKNVSKAKVSTKKKSVSNVSMLQRNVSPETFGLTLFALLFGMIGLVYVVATKAESL